MTYPSTRPLVTPVPRCFSQGVHPKLVQEMLGHATISIILDLYSHATPMMQERTATAMEVALA
jgi:integrase